MTIEPVPSATPPDDAEPFDPRLSGAIDAARAHLEAAEESGDPTMVAAFRKALDDLEARMPDLGS